MRTFSLGLPEIGVAYATASAHGYVVTAAPQQLTMAVRPPGGRRWRVYANGRVTRAMLRAGALVFTLPARARRAATWAITRTG
jgi:hypothetical protein